MVDCPTEVSIFSVFPFDVTSPSERLLSLGKKMVA